jgi:uncharacterized membrane protein required for colicin V production
MSDPDDRPQYDGVLLVLYSIVGIIAPMIIGIVYEDWLTGALLFFLCVASYMGYRLGFLKMLAFLGASYVVYLFAWPMGQALDPHIQNQFELSPMLSRVIGIGMAATCMFLLITIIGHFIVKMLYNRSERLELVDRILGFFVGVGEGGVLALIVLGAALTLAPICQQRIDLELAQVDLAASNQPDSGQPDNDNDQSDNEVMFATRVSQGVVSLAAVTEQSLLGPFFKDNNPLQEIPVVNQVENATVVLNDPAAMQELMEHPNIVGLAEQPAMKKTIDMVNNDPELQEFFKSGQIDQAALMQLAEHPGFMKIVDETNLMAEISTLFQQIQPALNEVGARHRPAPIEPAPIEPAPIEPAPIDPALIDGDGAKSNAEPVEATGEG